MNLAESSSLPLTTEIFQHVHSFLPPSSIATSTSVNREWRRTLLSASTLHTEIDLSRLNGTIGMKRILGHFVRLANLSNHSLVRVNLNLSSFWPIWKAKMKINQEAMGYNSLVETLTKSKSLKDVRLTIDVSASNSEPQASSIPFFLRLLASFRYFPSLKKVSIEAPSIVVLRAGEDSPGQKSFAIINNADRFETRHESKIGEVMALINTATNLVKDGLTEVSGLVLNPSQDFSLQDSFFPFRSTLRTLELSSYKSPFSATEIWEFATQCTQLSSLSLELFAPGEGAEELELPEDIEGIGLKKLKLIIGDIRLSSETQRRLLKWIGRGLEELHFDYRSTGPGPFLACSILQNSRETLKEVLLLGHIGTVEEAQQLQLGEYPNLQALRVMNVGNATLYEKFAQIEAPQLSLVDMTSEQDLPHYQPAYDCLVTLRKRIQARKSAL